MKKYLCAVMVVLLVMVGWSWGADSLPSKRAAIQRDLPSDLVTPEAQRVIDAGLEYLARSQNPNGSFGSLQYRDNIAVTSLAGLAMLSSGSMPGEGPFGENLDRAVEFVVKNTSAAGFVVVQRATSHGPMYDHGFGTLFLAEVYGMTRRADVREKLKKAVQLIVYTQNDEGGWRYQPDRRTPQADISVTICQIMALRAARNAGIHVPRGTVDRCIDYVRRSQNPDGGFRYMRDQGPSAFPRSAAGVVALFSAGVYEGKEIDIGLKYLMESMPGPRMARFRQDYHYFYGHYYAVQAMYQKGGTYWQQWYPAIRDELIHRARPEGSWHDSVCPEYGTAMACIILQCPNNYLPIFQR